MTGNPLGQSAIDSVWRVVWQRDAGSDLGGLLESRLFREIYSALKRFVPESPASILEVGGGTGRFGVALARDLPFAQVVITDILPEAGLIAGRLAEREKLGNVRVTNQDVYAISGKEQYDLVISDAVIQHLPDDAVAVRCMATAVKPGGWLIITAVNRWNFHTAYKKLLELFGREYEYGFERSYAPADLRKLLEDAGLEFRGSAGVYAAYGLKRLARRWSMLKPAVRVIDLAIRASDKIIRHRTSDLLGFEILAAARKT